jgi:ferredoxin
LADSIKKVHSERIYFKKNMAQITIKSANGTELGTFEADASQAISSLGATAGIMIPVACGIGACGICVAEIEAGAEYINPNEFGTGGFPLMDEQILTCVAGVKPDAPKEAKIILSCPNT